MEMDMFEQDCGMQFDHTEQQRYEEEGLVEKAFSNFNHDFNLIVKDLNNQYCQIRDHVFNIIENDSEIDARKLNDILKNLVSEDDLVSGYIDILVCRHFDDGLTEDMIMYHDNISTLRNIQSRMIDSLCEDVKRFRTDKCIYS